MRRAEPFHLSEHNSTALTVGNTDRVVPSLAHSLLEALHNLERMSVMEDCGSNMAGCRKGKRGSKEIIGTQSIHI